MCGCLLSTPTGDLTSNPGMCPGWELNWRLFGLQADIQSTEPHQPGHIKQFYMALKQTYFMIFGEYSQACQSHAHTE